MTTLPIYDSTAGRTLKYDAWNRLITVRDASSNLIQHNEYDGLGRRIVRAVYSGGSLDHKIHYYYNEEWQLLEERKEVSGTEYGDPLNHYLWHPYYIDALAVRWYDAVSNGTVSQTEYYNLHDANFNLTAIANSSGTVVERAKLPRG